MLEPFIPFTVAGASSSGAAKSAPFQRLDPQIPRAPQTRDTPNTRCGQTRAAGPIVSLRRNGEQVTHISVQCSCGEVIELECAY